MHHRQQEEQKILANAPEENRQSIGSHIERAAKALGDIEKTIQDHISSATARAQEHEERIRAEEADKQREEERRAAEERRKRRKEKILKSFTEFRRNADECMRKVLKGGDNSVYYNLKSALWNVPASRMCEVFKSQDIPTLAMHGFTARDESERPSTPDQSGRVNLFLDAFKPSIFKCMCEGGSVMGQNLIPTPSSDNRGPTDLEAIAREFERSVSEDMEKIPGP
eukprot:g3179.t1